jgi:serine/threonine protein kinase
VEGPTLGRLLKERTRLSVVDTQNIITQAISGLRAFHRRDVLHQDIKPDNIIYTEQEGIKIIDFGSCRSAGISQINTRINLEAKLGTRDYCAPEYLLNTPISPLSDQFSLAVLCYELLTGKHPFGTQYPQCQTEQDFARLKYIPAHTVNPLVPMWLDAAMQKALNIDPGKRYPALSEFTQDIKSPNPQLTLQRQSAGGLRDTLLFWKALVVGLALTNLVTLVLLVSLRG